MHLDTIRSTCGPFTTMFVAVADGAVGDDPPQLVRTQRVAVAKSGRFHHIFSASTSRNLHSIAGLTSPNEPRAERVGSIRRLAGFLQSQEPSAHGLRKLDDLELGS